MPPARAFWKGYLKLSLVSCPIALFPASSSSERVSFRQINKKTGHRLKQQLVDSVTGEAVESGDKGRGYQIGKDEYLPVEDEELDSLGLEAPKSLTWTNSCPAPKSMNATSTAPTTSPPRTRSGRTPLPSSVRP
jgi:DNA end-binding protein Ku